MSAMFEAPIAAALAGELRVFWDDIFEYSDEHPPDVPPEAYLGSETDHNRLTVYLERRAETPAGTCAITVPKTHPILGGFGEVATRPELRGSGIATRLCGRAVEDFRAAGGQALFLGTSVPAVRRIYHRLGWRKLAGADVMANISSGDSPEAFLVDYFRAPGEATVVRATPAVRVPMIPLLHAPHDWQVLDANAGMYSTRYCVQYSCMGLYRRYLAALGGGRGEWFGARTTDGRVVGLATARRAGAVCQVDGFAHPCFATVWPDLMAAAMRRAAAWGSSECCAVVCVEDEEKRALFEGLGFRDATVSPDFVLDGRAAGAVRMVAG
ncbi:MAG: GNAT family N-acetyltransferase [Spirochaetaceae bacterium]|nr:GNAT family N-acetyltransferase [Spirochaetaceae bacterium]